MSLLDNLRKFLYGSPEMSSIDTGDLLTANQQTQGLIGTGGEMGDGLLQQNFNKMNEGQGLLSNIPEGAILGAALYSQGLEGKDPLAGAFPAFVQAAQAKKLLTPKASKPTAYLNKQTGQPELVTPQKYAQNPEKYAPLPPTKMFETEEEKEIGKSFGKEFSEINKSSSQAFQNNANLDLMEQLVSLPNIQTGFAGQLRTDVASLAREFGIDTDVQDLTAAEALKGVSGKVVLDGLSNFKGAISDGERAFLVSITPGLTNSIEGNKLLINIGKRQNQLAIGLAEEGNNWQKENGGLSKKNSEGQTWSQYKIAWQKQNPVLNPKLKDEVLKVSKKVDPDFQNNIITLKGKKYVKIGGKFYEVD
tara:strand:- start:2464 stop:3549 length:1086 start_codon:yes stop_codon:yes gene_type:complete